MTVAIEQKEKRIGLALSGGGYRAAAFHLGVVRKLATLGLLDKIDVLSGVSGGAIVCAYLASNWGDLKAIDRLEGFIENESPFAESLLGGILNPAKSRTEKLAEILDEKLFRKQVIGDLSDAVRTYIGATNVGTGNLFVFAGGHGGCEIGEYELGYVRKPDFTLARAVAASCAYPVGYAPLKLDAGEYRLPAEYKYTSLIDGGVYDNLALGPLLRQQSALDYVIVSDAGFPYQYEAEPTESGLLVVKNTIDILMNQNRRLQFARLMSGWRAGSGPQPVWFSIDSENGEQMSGDAKACASIPTGLTKLERNQVTLLERHAGGLAQARIKYYASELLGARFSQGP